MFSSATVYEYLFPQKNRKAIKSNSTNFKKIVCLAFFDKKSFSSLFMKTHKLIFYENQLIGQSSSTNAAFLFFFLFIGIIYFLCHFSKWV